MLRTRLSRSCWGIHSHSSCHASCSFGIISGILSRVSREGLTNVLRDLSWEIFRANPCVAYSHSPTKNLATRADARNWTFLENMEARTDTKHDTATNKNFGTSEIVSFYDVGGLSMCSLLSLYVCAFRISSQTNSDCISRIDFWPYNTVVENNCR